MKISEFVEELRRGIVAKGRKALPTHLKIVKGTDRKDRENKDEPMPNRKIPDPPGHLNDIAKEEHKRMSGVLYNLGLLTEIDGTALAAYCEAYSVWVEACTVRNELGADWMTETTMNGNTIQRPIVGIINQARKAMKDFLVEFGMTPASRSKVSAKKSEDKKNPFSKLG